MFRKFKKPLVYLLVSMLVLPTYLLTSMFTAAHAEAATSKPTITVIGAPTTVVSDSSTVTDFYYVIENTTNNNYSGLAWWLYISNSRVSEIKALNYVDNSNNVVPITVTQQGNSWTGYYVQAMNLPLVGSTSLPIGATLTHHFQVAFKNLNPNVSETHTFTFGAMQGAASVFYDNTTAKFTVINAPIDSEPPVIAEHPDETVEATSSAGAIVDYIPPTATDNVDAPAPAICLPASGSTFPIGTSTVTCNKKDAAGNSANPTTFDVTVKDTTAPVVNLISPDGGEIYAAGDDVPIIWNSTDAVGSPANATDIYYSLDNGGSWTVINLGAAASGNITWTTPDINSDHVKVRVMVSDLYGNIGEDVSSNYFSIDNTLPESYISVDLQGQTYGPNTWDLPPVNGEISGTASDEVAGVGAIVVAIKSPSNLFWNGTSWQSDFDALVALGDVSTWSLPLDKTNLTEEGTYYIYASAVDNAGHSQNPPALGSFVWDATAPVVTVNNQITNNPTPTVTGTVDDSSASVTINVNGHTYAADVEGNDWAADITDDLPSGTYDVAATATDIADNSSSDSTNNELVVDLEAPAKPDFSVNRTGNGVLITWNLVDGASYYDVFRSESPYQLIATVNDPEHSYLDTNVMAGHSYMYKVVAYDLAGNASLFNEIGISLPQAVVVTTASTPVTTVATVATVAAPADTTTVTPPASSDENSITTPNDENGQIKGDENTATTTDDGDQVNWTPWIILFILIILAGAATGGYFYWFAGEEDMKSEAKKVEKVVEEQPKPKNKAASTKPAAKSSNKKSKRW